MKISVLQHAAFEGPGEIAAWAAHHGHAVGIHHLYRGDPLPDLDTFDLLVVMGGEMNIYQYRDWPWLKPERDLIQAALARGRRVVGICLGAQLIADALGARVVQNAEYEIGWLPITWTDGALVDFPELPSVATVRHGDTFELPAGATRLATSAGCLEQGFAIKGKCLALQFHMEVDPSLVGQFVDGQREWPTGQYAQTPKEILSHAEAYCDRNRRLLHGLLDRFCRG
jgi:GMP synthase-like glutamine amidotransferase